MKMENIKNKVQQKF